MRTVFQEIIDLASSRIREALMQQDENDDLWEPDAWEVKVREFTSQIGHELMQRWGEERSRRAERLGRVCGCGQRRQVNKHIKTWWATTFGRVEVLEAYLICPGCKEFDRPFKRLSGIECRSKSRALQRVLTDFGAEKSFGQASEQLWEHYGLRVQRDGVRRVVEGQAQRAERVIARRHQEAIKGYENRRTQWSGEEVLIAESDGSFARTRKLELSGGKTQKRGLEKKTRQTQWKEVRLSVVERPEREERLYGALMGKPHQVGEQLFALALLMGWGEQTHVHAVSDGAPWIAQQIAEVFPNHRFVLDRYHLLEYLHAGACGLPGEHALSAQDWMESQLSLIDEGKVDKVITECRALSPNDSGHPLMELARYLDNRLDQLDYTGAQQCGLPIGSGVVEAGHRHVIQARMKLPGTWWNEQTVNPMIALRTLRANGWWNDFWN